MTDTTGGSHALRVGIIGCGDAARRVHLPRLEAAGAEVIRFASADLADAEAAAAVAQHEAMATNDWRKVVTSPHIDAVDICTPSHLHAEMALAALDAGKHVLVESPMALTVRDADSLLKAAARKERMVVPAHSVRFIGPYRALAEAARSGKVGTVTGAFAEFGHQGPDHLYPGAGWYLQQARSGGGALMDLGVPLVDLLRLATGSEPVEATATISGQRGEVETRAEVGLQFASGAVAHIIAGWEGPANLIQIEGSEGTLRLDDRGARFLRPDGSEERLRPSEDGPDGIESVFVAAVTGGTPTVNALDGRAAVATVLAAYESARTGAAVNVPSPAW